MKTIFYTGSGDKGKSRVGAAVIAKDDPLFELLGDLDELNCLVGLARAQAQSQPKKQKGKTDLDTAQQLRQIQQLLFIAQAQCARRGFAAHQKKQHGAKKMPPPIKRAGGQKIEITNAHIIALEATIKKIDSYIPPLTKFVLPGGSVAAASLEVARAACRRTERSAVKMDKAITLPDEFLKFINRLSSVLFALARYENRKSGAQEEHPTYSS